MSDVEIGLADWTAAQKVAQDGRLPLTALLGRDITPIAEAIARARAEGYEEARMNFEENL